MRDAFTEDGVSLLELRTTPRALRDGPGGASSPSTTTTTRHLRVPSGAWLEGARGEVVKASPDARSGDEDVLTLPPGEGEAVDVDVDASLSHYVEAVVRGVQAETARLATKSWEEETTSTPHTLTPRPLVVRLLLSVNRTESLEASEKIARLAVAWSRVRIPAHRFRGDASSAGCAVDAGPPAFHRVVVGLDVSGDPTRGSLPPLLALLDRVLAPPPADLVASSSSSSSSSPSSLSPVPRRRRLLPVTVHAGEVMNVRETEAVLDWEPDRLGHMCVLSHSSVSRLLLLLSSSSSSSSRGDDQPSPIPIEVCPTSNALTLHLPSLYHHPTLSPWLHAGYPITICTDDSGVFDVTLSEEIAGVAHTHKLTPARTRELALAGFQHSFVEPEVKRWLMRRAKEVAEEAEEGGPGVAP